MAQITTQPGDVLLSHPNGRYALISGNTISPVAEIDGQLRPHSPSLMDDNYIERLQSIGWSEVPTNTDIEVSVSPFIWPAIVEPRPSVPDEPIPDPPYEAPAEVSPPFFGPPNPMDTP